MSPFATRAEEYGKSFVGGKTDDITIVIAQINLNGGTKSSFRNKLEVVKAGAHKF